MLVASASTIHVQWWQILLTVVGAFGSVTAGIAAMIRYIVKPLVAAASKVEQQVSFVGDLYGEYGKDGKELLSAEMRALTANQQASVANQQTMVAKLSELSILVSKVDDRVGDTRHAVIGEWQKVSAAFGTTTTIVDALLNVAAELKEVKSSLREVNAAVVAAVPSKED